MDKRYSGENWFCQETKDRSFDNFVRFLCADKCGDSLYVDLQKSWIVDKKNKVSVDFVGKFENLQEDVEKIAKKLNIEILLPHKRKSNKKKIYVG